MEFLHPRMNLINQSTGDVNVIFGGGNGRGNNSAPPSSPRTLGISGNFSSTTT